MRNGLVIAALTVVAVSNLAAANALLTLASPDAEFNEDLGGRAQVSGHVLVGLRIGASLGQFDPDEVRIALASAGEPAQSTTLCVRMISNDGRYWALNKYRAEAPLAATPRLEIRTRYANDLTHYGNEDIIVRAIETADCHEDSEGLVRPAVGNNNRTNSGRRLYAHVNTGGARAYAELFDAEHSIASVKCVIPTDRAAVSFSHVCALDLPAATHEGGFRLRVTARARTGARTGYDFNIWLPQ